MTRLDKGLESAGTKGNSTIANAVQTVQNGLPAIQAVRELGAAGAVALFKGETVAMSRATGVLNVATMGHTAAVVAGTVAHAAATVGMGAFNAVMSAGTAITGILNAETIVNTAGLVAHTVATGAQTVAQWALNAAFLACPLTWIIVGIAALVSAFVILWNNCAGFRNFWIGAWNGIQVAFGAVVGFIRSELAGTRSFSGESHCRRGQASL